MDQDLAKKAVGAIEDLIRSEIGSTGVGRFMNVQKLAALAQSVDRLASPRVDGFEADGMYDGEGMINVVGGRPIIANQMFGPQLGDMPDQQRQMMMALMPALADVRSKDRSAARANLAAETADLVRLRKELDLPPMHPQAMSLTARINANIAVISAEPDKEETDGDGSDPRALAPVPVADPVVVRGHQPDGHGEGVVHGGVREADASGGGGAPRAA